MTTKTIASLKESAATLLDHPVVSTKIVKSKRRGKTNCQVFCKETNTLYETISSVAKELGVDSWTIGKKMSAAGCFIDKNGNTYQRMTPMRTKNIYPNTGASIKDRYIRSSITRRKRNMFDNLPVALDSEAAAVENKGKIVAKKILAKEVMNYLQSEKYDSAANLLEVICGIK